MQNNNMDRDRKKFNFFQILPHVWVDLDMAGEHLDIIKINNNNLENKRLYSLRVILSYYLSQCMALFIAVMDFMPWGGFGQVIWGGYGHFPNPLQCPTPP